MTSRFWLRPKWVFGHLLCLTLVIGFIWCGFWQIRRLHEKQHRNALIHLREAAEPTSLDDALKAGAGDAVFRRVRVSGRWDAADTILVRSRSLNEEPGYHVLTPLVVGNRAVIVNRGFAPIGRGTEADILDFVRPKQTGTVRVSGLLLASEVRGGIGPRDPAGHLSVVNRIDIPRLAQQIDLELAPVYLQLASPQPPDNAPPRILPTPATDEGPHKSYAIQWFLFASVGIVGYPILLRKTSRDLAREGGSPDDAPPRTGEKVDAV